jgi:hypothetical protein
MRNIFLAGLLIGLTAAPSFAVNGTAVSIAWQGDTRKLWIGKLVRFDIEDNTTVRCDTLSHAMCLYPALSFDGTRVAFFKTGASREGGQLIGRDEPCSLAVINIDGTAERSLIPVDFPSVNCQIDWPIGERVYYQRPEADNQGNGSGEIWRVDVSNPADNELVYDYTPTDDGYNYLRRWDISADGRWSSIQMISNADWGGQVPHCFPPPPEGPRSCMPEGRTGACNMAMSTTGTYIAKYSGRHDFIDICHWDHDANTLDILLNVTLTQRELYGIQHDGVSSWIGVNLGESASGELIRWAVNSEKWVLQQIGWEGHAKKVARGSNQLIVNWKDKEAILTSTNPRGGTDGVYYCNTTGDFRVEGPAGKVELASGEWVPVDAVESVRMSRPGRAMSVKPALRHPRLRIGTVPRSITIPYLDTRNGVYTLTGRAIETTGIPASKKRR